jgi:tetraacyldisaccharide 4'-kinase
VEFARRLKAGFPNTRLFVSTGTLAGRAAAAQKLECIADGVFYAPVDYVFAVRRVLRTLRPWVVIVAETEIWPNLFRETRRTGAGLAIVNGRISDRAWARYRCLAWFFSVVLPAADCIFAQTDAIAARFTALGAPPERVRASGNFKYDFEARTAPADSPVMALLRRSRPTRVWVAASTMPPAEPGDSDEDDTVVAAFRDLAPRHSGLLLIWAPRKPERFDLAGRKLEAAGISYLRRSRLTGGETAPLPGVLLLDSIGELAGLFATADVVFMGGTLPHRGGHNILEPAMFAKPVIAGPHMENFQAIAEDFRAAGAYLEIARAEELAAAVERLLAEPETAAAFGRRALACAEARRGASGRAAAAIRELADSLMPRYRPAVPWYWIAWLLSRIWIAGGRRRAEAQLRTSRSVDAPVISVGNLTMGGTGKTPCVLLLAGMLKAGGHSPGILTRGYKRSSPEAVLTLAPGSSMPAVQSGDEPQIFARSGLAPVGIGADRYRAGMLLQRDFRVDVLLLDDGYQHLRLARDLDILLIDGLNPFGGCEVFPLGRLRQPLGALERAGLIVITRSEFTDLAQAVERLVRRWNAHAPVFHAAVRPVAWVSAGGEREYPVDEPPFARAGAFCGLGNPEAFRRTLQRLPLELAGWHEFADHHHYRPHQLHHLAHEFAAAGATAAVTTEKDLVNIPEDAAHLLEPLALYWLKTTMAIEREAAFLEIVAGVLRPAR